MSEESKTETKTPVRKLTTAQAAKEAGAKVPADHKSEEESEFTDRVVTFAGKDWTIKGEELDDFEFLRAFRDQDAPTMAEVILGDQMDDFLAALKKENGGKRARGSDVVKFINKTLEVFEAKN